MIDSKCEFEKSREVKIQTRMQKYAHSKQIGNGGKYFFMSVVAILVCSVYITLTDDIDKFQSKTNFYSDTSKSFSLNPTTSSTTTSTISTSTSSTSTISTLASVPNKTEEWLRTPLAKDRPMAICKSLGKCKGNKYWTGSWPSKSELPLDQRRDTACPYTLKNETRKRIKRWPDIIGIGAPKCGTGLL